jgi:hypothetical protein
MILNWQNIGFENRDRMSSSSTQQKEKHVGGGSRGGHWVFF